MELYDYASKNLPSQAEEFSLPPDLYMNPEEEEDAKVECICSHCGKGFKTKQAMNGHMRIHDDGGGLKYNVVESLEAGPNRLRGGATKILVWKQTLDKHGPEAVLAAFTLMELSRSKSYIDSSQMNKKRKTMESDPLDLDEKKHMHDPSENSNTNFPSDQALVEHPSSSHKKSPKRKRKVVVKVRGESGSQPQPHVCEICNDSYETGQQLGGHKRAHYKKDPSEEVQKSPDSNRKRKRERKTKVKSKSGSHSHVCEVCNKSYPTGHQLGGHMRAHQKKDPSPINEQVPNGDDLADHMAQNAVNEWL